MTLVDWVKNDWLKTHQTSKEEIQGLWSIVERELKDSQVEGISSDGQFNHAYRAALTLATILLYISGYAPTRTQSHHHRTIETIPKILGTQTKDDAAYLQNCRAKRNASEYDADNEASSAEADELIQFVKEFKSMVKDWVKNRGF